MGTQYQVTNAGIVEAPTVQGITGNLIIQPAPSSGDAVLIKDDTGATVITVQSGTAILPSTSAVTSIHADSNTNLTGSVQLVSGTNVTLSQVGQAITVNATGGGSSTPNAYYVTTQTNTDTTSTSPVVTNLSIANVHASSNTGILSITVSGTTLMASEANLFKLYLFEDGASIAASPQFINGNGTGSNLIHSYSFTWQITPGDTANHTFDIRIASNDGTMVRWCENGSLCALSIFEIH